MPPSGPSGDTKAIRDALKTFASEENDAVYRAAIETLAATVDEAPERLLAALADAEPDLISSPAISIVDDSWLAGAVVRQDRVTHADPSLQPMTSGEMREALLALTRGAARAARSFATLRMADGSLAVAVAARAQLAAAWPLSPSMRAALEGGGTAILVFAPGSHAGLQQIVETAFGLTKAEARLATLLFRGASAEQAADELGVASETARKTVRSLLRKTGALRRADLSARIAELLAGHYLRGRSRHDLIREAFALSASEADVAEAIAHGLTVPEIAERRRVSVHTVRTQLDAALLKTGVARASELARILINLCALVSWTSCSEPQRQDQRLLIAATRMVPAPGNRLVAAADYGPPGRPSILCLHPALSYRWVRRRLRESFHARGFRTLSYDRAACGLSDPQEGHPFDVAAEDAARVLDRFRIARTNVFASFGASGAAVTFAARFPDRVDQVVMLMPRPPRSETVHPSALSSLWRSFADRPAVADTFYEAFRFMGGSRFWRWLHRQVAMASEADRATLNDHAYNDERMAEIYASIARSWRGTRDVDRAHRDGWGPPPGIGGARWTVLLTSTAGAKMLGAATEDWSWLPNGSVEVIADAGRLAMHTHASRIAGAFEARPHG